MGINPWHPILWKRIREYCNHSAKHYTGNNPDWPIHTLGCSKILRLRHGTPQPQQPEAKWSYLLILPPEGTSNPRSRQNLLYHCDIFISRDCSHEKISSLFRLSIGQLSYSDCLAATSYQLFHTVIITPRYPTFNFLAAIPSLTFSGLLFQIKRTLGKFWFSAETFQSISSCSVSGRKSPGKTQRDGIWG